MEPITPLKTLKTHLQVPIVQNTQVMIQDSSNFVIFRSKKSCEKYNFCDKIFHVLAQQKKCVTYQWDQLHWEMLQH